MKRRELLKSIGLTPIGLYAKNLGGKNIQTDSEDAHKSYVTVAHITDVHIRKGDNAPERFINCLKQILDKHKPDFFLNGGDSINDASYDNVTRESVTEQWAIWDECIREIDGYEIHACIGNHDTWWKAPSESDEMYGKPYAVKRLRIPDRYYSFTKGKWHFIILDGNNKNISLDKEQFEWLKNDLDKIPPGTHTLIMSHYPILGTTQVLVGGGHSDYKELKDLFYRHKDKVRICLSGHNHLSDKTFYNTVQYCCNGAMSGYWWGKGDKESAGPGYYMETPPGYAVLKLYDNGDVENAYYPHGL